MFRFVQFFLVGIAIGAIVVWLLVRDSEQRTAIEELTLRLDSLQFTEDLRNLTESRNPRASDRLPDLPDVHDDIYQGRETAITRAISRSSDAVVGISVAQVTEVVNPFLPRDPLFRMFLDERYWPRTIRKQASSLGSGFLITSDGYIVTNQHVVENATEVTVTTTSGNKYGAKIVGTDALLDMALLKIEATGLPYLEWANSDQCMVGEWVIAIGNPYGLFDVNDQPSASVGVISAVNRDFERDSDGRLYSDMIQTDAAINHGNSGGPLINAEGRAVGMNTLIFSESGGNVGIGFSIPSNRIVNSIEDLLHGGVDRDFWLGLRANDLRGQMWKRFGLAENRGAVVTGVDPGSPAQEADIRTDDVILQINDRQIDCAGDARDYVNNTDLRVGDHMTILVSRHGKILTKKLKLIPIPRVKPYIER